MALHILTDFDHLPDQAFWRPAPGSLDPLPVRLRIDRDGNVAVHVVDALQLQREQNGDVPVEAVEWNLPAGITPASAKQLVADLQPKLESLVGQELDKHFRYRDGGWEVEPYHQYRDAGAVRTFIDIFDTIRHRHLHRELDVLDIRHPFAVLHEHCPSARGDTPQPDAIGWPDHAITREDLMAAAERQGVHVLGGPHALDQALAGLWGLDPRHHVIVCKRAGDPFVAVHRETVANVQHDGWPNRLQPLAGEHTGIKLTVRHLRRLPRLRYSEREHKWALRDPDPDARVQPERERTVLREVSPRHTRDW